MRPDHPRPLGSATHTAPDTSVVVPTHNDGRNIGPLLHVLLGEPTVAEVVVVASGCTDDTVEIVKETANVSDGRVRLYVEHERRGKAPAMNLGLAECVQPYLVVVSGDVLPEPGVVPLLVDALRAPGVGLAGGRPLPVNPERNLIGHAVHLLWRMHHHLALHQPKLGEIIAINAAALVTLPPTSVDEACFQALVEHDGWKSVYLPEAVVHNRGPGTVKDFVKQRRQINTGHLFLRKRQHYTVASLHPTLLLVAFLLYLREDRTRLRPASLARSAATIGMELWARLLAHVDELRGRELHVWDMVESAKDPALGADRLGGRDQ